MKSSNLIPLTSAIVVTVAQALQANDWTDVKITAPISPTPGWLNETLRKNDPYRSVWNLGALYWTRYEVKENGGFIGAGSLGDFRRDIDNDNSYLLQKILPRVGYTSKWVDVFVQGRHSSVTGDDRSANGNGVLTVSTNGVVTAAGGVGGGSSPEADGPIDLQQAYITLGNHKEFPVSLKLGRQEFVFGEQRVVGALPWNNIQRQWDGARMRWQNPWFTGEAFTSMVVMPDDGEFNKPNNKELFSGVNIYTKNIPKLWSEFYFWSRNAGRGANNGSRGQSLVPMRPPEAQDVYTVGTYLKNSTNDWQNVDFGLQAYYQFGNFADFRERGGAGPRRDHRAWALVAAGGYTWKESALTPRLGVEYSFGSGDDDPNDNKHQTFVHLYPTGHLFYGYADFVSLQNIHNIRLRSSIQPFARLKLALEGHLRWLDSVNDNFYNVAGLPRGGITFQPAAAQGTSYGINPTASSSIGTEIDATATWNVNKFTTLELNYSHITAGNYIKNSLQRVGSQNAHYVYVQMQVQF